MNIIPVFPSLIFSTNIVVLKELKEYTLNLQQTESGVSYSNKGGWQSSSYLHNDDYFVEKYLNYFAVELNKQSILPTWSMNACWLNVNYKSNYNMLHDHPKCDYSLVWYISTPENCGNIVFENPHSYHQCGFLNHVNPDISQCYNVFPSYTFVPKEGDCYLFPSHLKHLVQENLSNDARISMSANIDFIDKQR